MLNGCNSVEQAAEERELKAIQARIWEKLGPGVGEKRMRELLRLAHFNMQRQAIRSTRSPSQGSTTDAAARPARRVPSLLISF